MNNYYILVLCLSHFLMWYLGCRYNSVRWMSVVRTLREVIKILDRGIELSKENFDLLGKNLQDEHIANRYITMKKLIKKREELKGSA